MSRILSRLRLQLGMFGISGLLVAIFGKLARKQLLLQVRAPSLSAPLFVRCYSTDIGVFEQIFRRHEYQFEVTRPPRFVVDAGANIGLTAVYLANRFPEARILAIEPVASNFELLRKNAAPYPNIIPVAAALWGEAAQVDVLDPGLGGSGYRVAAPGDPKEDAAATGQKVQAITIKSILDNYGLDQLDLLKIDIEGAEVDVFRHSGPWIERVDSMVVELHERFAPGCNRSFYHATGDFDFEWSQGELTYLTRRGGCLQPASPVLIADA